MADVLNDGQIANLMTEVKPLPDDYRSRVVLRQKRGHSERELDIDGAGGSKFRLILRQASFNALDFSVILAWLPPQANTIFRLCRFNGKSHEHTNTLENETFYDFHIHRATQRYQLSGLREDAFAERTNRYQDLTGAQRALFQDGSFRLPDGDQLELL